MKVRIGGKSWEIQRVRNLRDDDGKRVDGLCDSPWEKEPKLWLDAGLKGEQLVRAAIHETLHTRLFGLEGVVRVLAGAVFRVLKKLDLLKL